MIQPLLEPGVGTANLFEEDSDLEVDFIEYLEKSKGVESWFKNGKSDATCFAVPWWLNMELKDHSMLISL